MMRRAVLWLALMLLAGACLACLSQRLPAVAGPDTPPDRFSAARAMAHVEAIAQRPHPVGSPEHERVRTVITERMAGLGLSVEIEQGMAQVTDPADGTVIMGQVRNILARLPGRDRRLPALVLMAHYDTVPHSPGAGDDGAGVATLIETARALGQGQRPLRDVIFLFTDGEEIGMLGARHFFARRDPRSVLAALNFEARGAGGRALLFETGANTRDLVAAYGAVPAPSSNATTASVYGRMPNGTDLTVALDRGIPGLNFAIMGRQAAYHSAAATPDFLDPRSVQHMGDQALALARSLSARPNPLAPEPRSVWFDLFGILLVQYPAGLGWVPVALAGALLAGTAMLLRRREALPARAVLSGGVYLLAISLASAAALAVAGAAARGLALGITGADNPAGNAGWWFAGLPGVALGAALLCARPERGDGLARWLGASIALWLLAAGAQTVAPTLAWLPGWTVLTLALGLLLALSERGRRWTAIIVIPALGLVLSAAAWLAIAVGIEMPAALALPIMFAVPLLWPWLAAWRAGRGAAVQALGIGGFGLAALAVAAVLPSPTPIGSEIFLLADRTAGRAYLATSFAAPDRWTRATLTAAGAVPEAVRAIPPIIHSLRGAPVPMPTIHAPDVELGPVAGARNRWRLLVRPSNGGTRLRVALRPARNLGSVTIAGTGLAGGLPSDRWTTLDIHGLSADGVALDYIAPSPGALNIRVLEMGAPWPANAVPLPVRPAHIAPVALSDRMMVLDARRFAWGG